MPSLSPNSSLHSLSARHRRPVTIYCVCLHIIGGSHAPNFLFVGVLLESRVEVRPPLKEHGLADELEPWRDLDLWVGKQRLQLIRGNVLRILHLVLVDVQIDVRLDE